MIKQHSISSIQKTLDDPTIIQTAITSKSKTMECHRFDAISYKSYWHSCYIE